MSAVTHPAAARMVWLDAIRGLAVALMVVDHIAVVYDMHQGVRDITRIALPLFMLAAGYCLRGWSPRHLEVAAVAALTYPLAVLLGIAWVPVLVVFSLVLILAPLIVRYPVLLGAAGVLQFSAWPLGWYGYEPGVILALVALGQCARRDWYVPDLPPELDYWAPARLAAWAGRYPLMIYAGHLLLLFGITKPL